MGYPFLVQGEGLAPASAAVLLSLLDVAASILLIIGIGVVLDLLTPAGTGAPPLSVYRWAFTLQHLLWTVGAVQVLRYRSRIRRAAIRGLSLPVR